MSIAQESSNKAIVRRLCELWNTRDAEFIANTIDEIFEPDVLFHERPYDDATGTQVLKQVVANHHRAFLDVHVTIEDLIADGDRSVARNVVTGTHQGEYRGLPPTGKHVTYNEIFILRFVDGRIAETWAVVDVFSQMKQLGAIPS